MRARLKLESLLPREERRAERDIRRQRAAAGRLIEEIAERVEMQPTTDELVHLARALAEASGAQRLASGALLALARVRLDRALADEDEPVADESVH